MLFRLSRRSVTRDPCVPVLGEERGGTGAPGARCRQLSFAFASSDILDVLDREIAMTGSATTEREEHPRRQISSAVPLGEGLLDRKDLLELLDQAVTKRVTMISAPPGSGKTSLLRAWVGRSTNHRRVAFVSVDREQQDAQTFWSAVLDATRGAARSTRHSA